MAQRFQRYDKPRILLSKIGPLDTQNCHPDRSGGTLGCLSVLKLPDCTTYLLMETTAYLSLGSNVGNRAHHLRDATARLLHCGRVLSVSSIYETEPVDFTEQPWFLNCALALATTHPPQQLMTELLRIEKDMGRERTQPKGPRTIDIDLLLYGDVILNSAGLTIPHPQMHRRRFVLEPLAEIAPEARHPLLQRSVRELLENLPEGQIVRRIAKANDRI